MVQRRKGAAKDAAARFGEFPGDVQRNRLRFVMRVLVFSFAVIVLRLTQLHLLPSDELTEEVANHTGVARLYAPRGDIRDKNNIVLATDRKVPSLWVDPRGVTDPEVLAPLIAKRVGIRPDEVMAKLTQTDAEGKLKKFVWIKRWLMDVPQEVFNELDEASDGAVQVQYEALRYYPQKDLASHIIGFCNRDGEAGEGAEALYDKYLKSVPGKYIARKDGRRHLLGNATLEEPQGGDNVILTLDSKIQHNLEAALDQRMIDCNAKHAMGIVLDPADGAIRALACRPAYDPNNYDETDPELRKNRAIIDVFEPGSAFKIVTASAALEHDLITPETRINCENGGFNPYGHYVKDFHKLGVEPFRHCFAESSNVAMIKVGAMLGPERLDQWIQRYGFGKATSREFRSESRGMYHPYPYHWSKLTMGSLPMGQEIAVTMMQLARAFAVIANDGFLIEPHYVERVESRDERDNNDKPKVIYQYTPPAHERILSPSTCATMKELCAGVVTDGTGEKAQILEYRVGGKTGTAQIARQGGGGYVPGAFTTVFAGFAPVTHPRLVCVIVVGEPMIKQHFGGFVCGPVFQSVVREALIDMNVPQDPVIDKDGVPMLAKLKKEGKIQVPQIVDEFYAEDATGDDAELGVESPDQHITLAAQEIAAKAAQKPDPKGAKGKKGQPEPAPAPAPVPAHVAVESGQLPDFRGMTKRQVQEVLLPLGIPWDTQGAGWVVTQDPQPGTPLTEVGRCGVVFGPREQAKAQDEPQKRL